MPDDKKDETVYVPEFRQGAKGVYRAVVVFRYAVIAILCGFVAAAVLDDDLAALFLEAEFDRTAAHCAPPEGFAISLRNGSWKTAKRFSLSIRAQRNQAATTITTTPTPTPTPYIWLFSVDQVLEPGADWSGCVTPSLSTKSNRVVFKNPDAFTWEVDGVGAEFSD